MNLPIYILAQGKSSRMGRDKGLVKINGKEMILHCIENLMVLEQEIIIISSNTDYEKFGFRIISDRIENRGPAQGIITALEDLSKASGKPDQCMIVSCDMPLVNDKIIQRLCDLSVGQAGLTLSSTIACFEGDSFYPFPGIYSKSILTKWKSEVDNGNLKMQSLIKQFSHKTLPIEHPELFLNVNTPSDVLVAAKKLK